MVPIGKASKLLLLVMLALIVGSFLTGCGVGDKVKSLRQNVDNSKELTTENSIVETIPEVLVEVASPVSLGQTVDVQLFFGDAKGKTLAVERRVIPKVEGIGRATISELIKGPSKQSGLVATVPTGTTLLDINVRPDGLAIVDFSREIIDNHPGGATAENLTVYSVVNTLAQFPSVNRVQLLVEGQNVTTLVGHTDVSAALTPDLNLVQSW